MDLQPGEQPLSYSVLLAGRDDEAMATQFYQNRVGASLCHLHQEIVEGDDKVGPCHIAHFRRITEDPGDRRGATGPKIFALGFPILNFCGQSNDHPSFCHFAPCTALRLGAACKMYCASESDCSLSNKQLYYKTHKVSMNRTQIEKASDKINTLDMRLESIIE